MPLDRCPLCGEQGHGASFHWPPPPKDAVQAALEREVRRQAAEIERLEAAILRGADKEELRALRLAFIEGVTGKRAEPPQQLERPAFMLQLIATLADPPSCECAVCQGQLLCVGDEHRGWKLACMWCGIVAFEEIPPRHETIRPPPIEDTGERE